MKLECIFASVGSQTSGCTYILNLQCLVHRYLSFDARAFLANFEEHVKSASDSMRDIKCRPSHIKNEQAEFVKLSQVIYRMHHELSSRSKTGELQPEKEFSDLEVCQN